MQQYKVDKSFSVLTLSFVLMLQALVATTDSVDAFSLLQNMAPMSYDSSRLIDVACISFSSTDRAHLASLQAKHRQTVLAQFAVIHWASVLKSVCTFQCCV